MKQDTSVQVVSAEDKKEQNLPLLKHIRPFYSLDVIHNKQELFQYWKRFAGLRSNFSDTSVDRYYLDCKLAGVPVQVEYAGGNLIKAITKFDGRQGEDVTDPVLHLPNMPHRIGIKQTVVIRGEILIHRDDFYLLNQQLEDKGLESYDTMTECVVDVLRNKPELVLAYILRFYAWEFFIHGKPELLQSMQIDQLTRYGFNVPYGRLCDSTMEMSTFIQEITESGRKFPYEINGVVIKQNDPDFRKALGVKDGIELAKCIWRLSDGLEVCKVKHIDWRLQHTGKLQPVAIVEPISICDYAISEVPLPSWHFVQENKLGAGARIEARASSDATSLALSKILTTGRQDAKSLPEHCSCCGGKLRHFRHDVYCTNPSCPGVLESKLNFIMSEECLDYSTFTKEMVHEVVTRKMVTSLIDLFTVIESTSDVVSQRTLDNLVSRMRKINFMELILILSIPGIGQAVAGRLAMETKTIQGLMDSLANSEYFNLLPVSAVVKTCLAEWYAIPEHRTFLQEVQKLHLQYCA